MKHPAAFCVFYRSEYSLENELFTDAPCNKKTKTVSSFRHRAVNGNDGQLSFCWVN